MAKEKQKDKRDTLWAEAKRRCRLSEEDVRMAKEMGLNPRSLIKNIPSKSEPWKAPVKYWVRDIYRKRQEKVAKRRERREEKRDEPVEGDARTTLGEGPPALFVLEAHSVSHGQERADHRGQMDDMDVRDSESPEFEKSFEDNHELPIEHRIANENRKILRRQQEFRTAAEYVAAAFARVPEVKKVVLFGSVALPLEKEVPRFWKFRRAGIPIWRECRDADIAVWLSNLGCLRTLRRAAALVLNVLLYERDIGVAHHQLDIFIMEPGSDRFLGNLCCFGECPKGKPECDVPGCGATPFLRQHEKFSFNPTSLQPEKVVVLFDRRGGADHRTMGGEISMFEEK